MLGQQSSHYDEPKDQFGAQRQGTQFLSQIDIFGEQDLGLLPHSAHKASHMAKVDETFRWPSGLPDVLVGMTFILRAKNLKSSRCPTM
jgi:hypothetical protein